MKNISSKKLNIAFVHPDLGIGGAERLVVDAAIGLLEKSHHVVIYTSYFDPKRAFEELQAGKIDVEVYGNQLPREIYGKGHVVFAILKSWILAFAILAFSFFGRKYDVLIVDQLSASIPILRLTGSKILFYCHFPDKLLSKRSSMLKNIYRLPLDFLEEITTKMADVTVVNSNFTASIFHSSFPLIHIEPRVLYPGIALKAYDKEVDFDDPSVASISQISRKPFILSINRFERKKNISLGIESFNICRTQLKQELLLVLAGGWDARVSENVEYLSELQKLASEAGLKFQTWSKDFMLDEGCNLLFIPSFTDSQRTFLLSTAQCLIYTPSGEHFGIVPLEGMYCRLPVVAVNSGGPTETVIHEKTGYLCPPDNESFAEAIKDLISSPLKREAMGLAGRSHVATKFSLDRFSESLEETVIETIKSSNLDAAFTHFCLIVLLGSIIPLLVILPFIRHSFAPI